LFKKLKDSFLTTLPIKLSICIPTFNFGKFVGETLESIIPQLTDQTEIVVLDGGSTDNTPEIVQSYQKKCAQIRYFRQPVRGGIDKDMHLSVEKAEGEYCWLFSSDDIMRPGSINKILNELDKEVDVYLFDYTICEFDCKTPIREHYILKNRNKTIYNLSDPTTRAQYFSLAIQTTALFSFMSALVIKRAKWLTTNIEDRFFGSCWAHAVRILHMIPQGLTVKYVPFSLLLNRSFNDSFLDKGIVHRFSITIDGYQEIMHGLFGEHSIETYHTNRVLRADFPARSFLASKLLLKNKTEKKTLIDLFKKIYSHSPARIRMMRLLLAIPNPLIASLKTLQKMGRRLKQSIYQDIKSR
jgi:abequosyltransferase